MMERAARSGSTEPLVDSAYLCPRDLDTIRIPCQGPSTHRAVAARLTRPDGTHPEVRALDPFDNTPAAEGTGYLVLFAHNGLNELELVDPLPCGCVRLERIVAVAVRLVLASRTGRFPHTVALHPAAADLIPPSGVPVFTTSDDKAALWCVAGRTDGCVTYPGAAAHHGLTVVQEFGPTEVVFGLYLVRPNGPAQ